MIQELATKRLKMRTSRAEVTTSRKRRAEQSMPSLLAAFWVGLATLITAVQRVLGTSVLV